VGDHPEGAAIGDPCGVSQGAVEPLGQIREGDLIGEGAPLGDADGACVNALGQEPVAPGREGRPGVGVAVDQEDGGRGHGAKIPVRCETGSARDGPDDGKEPLWAREADLREDEVIEPRLSAAAREEDQAPPTEAVGQWQAAADPLEADRVRQFVERRRVCRGRWTRGCCSWPRNRLGRELSEGERVALRRRFRERVLVWT
jgi:hypothetical protein